MFLCDGYADKPRTKREVLAQRVMRVWSDSGDIELRQAWRRQAFDKGGRSA
jgi:hypothetical protein